MNTIYKSIISIGSIFCLIEIASKKPDNIEILGMQIPTEPAFFLVFFILSFVSTIGVATDRDQKKTEKVVFLVLGALATLIFSRLWLSNLGLGLYITGLTLCIVSLFLGLMFSLWHQVLQAKKYRLYSDQDYLILPAAIRAYKINTKRSLILFILVLLVALLLDKYCFENQTYILSLTISFVFLSPSLYELILLINGRFGSERSRRAYRQKQESINKAVLMHDYKYQLGGFTPLSDQDPPAVYKYVAMGNLELVKQSIENGEDPNSKTRVGWSILCLAVADGNFEIAKYLLSVGANPNVLNALGRSPICYAALYGNEDMVKLLLNHGAQPNLYSFPEERGPLHMAVVGGHIEVVKILLPHITLKMNNDNKFIEYEIALGTKVSELIKLIAKKINEQGDVEPF